MSDTSLAIIGALISGPIGIVIGTVFGYWLNERSISQREARAIARHNHNIHMLLFREIEAGVADLRTYLFQIKHQSSGAVWEGNSTEIAFQERRQFLQLPPPRLSHTCWESQLSSAPDVLTAQQLEATHHFHAQLDKITATYRLLHDDVPDKVLSAVYEEWKTSPQEGRAPLDRFVYLKFANGTQMGEATGAESRLLGLDIEFYLHRNAQLWLAFEGLINDLLQRGNPLPEADEARPNDKAFSLRGYLTGHVPFRNLRSQKAARYSLDRRVP